MLKSAAAFPRKIAILSIRAFYHNCLSSIMLPACRFYPSCSEYAKESLARHGLIKGLLMSMKRILKCQPLCKGGYDPVK